jgi:hypothetical protein
MVSLPFFSLNYEQYNASHDRMPKASDLCRRSIVRARDTIFSFLFLIIYNSISVTIIRWSDKLDLIIFEFKNLPLARNYVKKIVKVPSGSRFSRLIIDYFANAPITGPTGSTGQPTQPISRPNCLIHAPVINI